ncbi:MAG: hypothetical protein Q8M07_03470 [Prosthecobacter sp.]|nr:hypothetical protein [Prosthecobacter sp.]
MKIAGKNTNVQWFTLKTRLQSTPSQALWDSAFRRFYRKRIDTRYLNPIASIRDTQSGEGFAITALFCSLIGFLESCERGHNFRLVPASQLQPHEYNQNQVRLFQRIPPQSRAFQDACPYGTGGQLL